MSLREISAIMRNENRNFYAAFIDLKSAFDRVSRVLLFLELHDVGIRGKMWKMLRALYKNTTVGIGPDLILDKGW